jgi:divalent metal cation (Fe/Co/Zn/Cd) transporter
MRLSRVLIVSLINVTIVLISFVILYLRTVPEPWDVVLVVVIMLVCPVGGLWLSVSQIKEDRSHGVSKWQTIFGVFLSLAIFAYGLFLLTTRS